MSDPGAQPPLVPPSPRSPAGWTATPSVAPPNAAGWPPGPPVQPTPPTWWSPSGSAGDPAAAQALRTARTALGWAIGAAVGAGLALVGLLGVLVLNGSGIEGGAEDDYVYETMRGEVVGLPEGSPLSGDRLERPIVDLLRGYGVEEAEVSCPDTPSVSVSTVVACTGEVDDYEWTGVVVFEDSQGSFAVVEL